MGLQESQAQFKTPFDCSFGLFKIWLYLETDLGSSNRVMYVHSELWTSAPLTKDMDWDMQAPWLY